MIINVLCLKLNFSLIKKLNKIVNLNLKIQIAVLTKFFIRLKALAYTNKIIILYKPYAKKKIKIEFPESYKTADYPAKLLIQLSDNKWIIGSFITRLFSRAVSGFQALLQNS